MNWHRHVYRRPWFPGKFRDVSCRTCKKVSVKPWWPMWKADR